MNALNRSQPLRRTIYLTERQDRWFRGIGFSKRARRMQLIVEKEHRLKMAAAAWLSFFFFVGPAFTSFYQRGSGVLPIHRVSTIFSFSVPYGGWIGQPCQGDRVFMQDEKRTTSDGRAAGTVRGPFKVQGEGCHDLTFHRDILER